MATVQFATAYNWDTDAAFRASGLEFSTKLQEAGLIKTSDTGQIDWSTAVRAAYPTRSGFEVYRFPDALHSTSPVFIKIYYGGTGTASNPAIGMEIGTATNGAGAITANSSGEILMFNTASGGATISDKVTAVNSYICVKDSYVGVVWKVGTNSYTTNNLGSAMLNFVVCRTCNSDGTFNSDGVMAVWHGGSMGTHLGRSLNLNTGTWSTAANGFGYVPYGITTTSVGGDVQAFGWFGAMPKVYQMLGALTVVTSEVPYNTTFSTAAIGSTPRTYLSVPGWTSVGGYATAAHNAAILWE